MLLGASQASAQHVLLVQVGNLQLPVRASRSVRPEVEVDGKLVPVPNPIAPMVLHVADAYCNGSIKEEELGIEIRYPGFGGDVFLEIEGHLTSDTDLSECYFVIMWDTPITGSHTSGGYTFMTAQLPNLKAGKRTSIGFTRRLPWTRSDFFEGEQYWAHIFSGKRECLTSAILDKAPGEKYKQLRYLALRKAYRPPVAFFNPVPMALDVLPSVRPGSAMVELRISADGDVISPLVTGCSRPEFGEFALSAMKQWLFAPAIENNQYVEVPGRFLFTFPAEPERSIPSLKDYQELYTRFFGESLMDLDGPRPLSRLNARFRAMTFDQALADLKGRVAAKNPSVLVGDRTGPQARVIFVQAVIRYEADAVAYKATQRLDLLYSSGGAFLVAALRSPAYTEQHPVEVQPL